MILSEGYLHFPHMGTTLWGSMGQRLQIFGVFEERVNLEGHKKILFFRMGPIPSRDLKCVFTGSENKNQEDSYFHKVYALDLEIGIVFFAECGFS